MNLQAQLVDCRALVGAADYLGQAATLAGAVPAGARDPDCIRRIGVLGAGTMGRGIAMTLAQAGRTVVLVDPSDQALASARAYLASWAERQLAKGRIDTAGHAALLDRIGLAASVESFAGCYMVIEAVPEILALKREVLTQIETVVGHRALITSNTSTLDVDAIAAALDEPGRFIGTHFFLPAQVNRLLELVPAATTAPETLGLTLALARDLGKQAVVAANGDGFIGNRLFDRFHQEAMYLLEEGAWPEDVDAALEDWGLAIGPFRALDMVGNDIPWGVRKQRTLRPTPPHQPKVGDALCDAGFFGRKTGKGWYSYDNAQPKGRPSEDINALIAGVSRQLGRVRRRIEPEEIVGRCITALIIEGSAMLEEGRAERASDIDLVYVTGYGFPAAIGGPMRLGETLGAAAALDLARHYGEISGRSSTAWALPTALTGRRNTA